MRIGEESYNSPEAESRPLSPNSRRRLVSSNLLLRAAAFPAGSSAPPPAPCRGLAEPEGDCAASQPAASGKTKMPRHIEKMFRKVCSAQAKIWRITKYFPTPAASGNCVRRVDANADERRIGPPRYRYSG